MHRLLGDCGRDNVSTRLHSEAVDVASLRCAGPAELTHDADRSAGRTGHITLVLAGGVIATNEARRPLGVSQHQSREAHVVAGRVICARTDVPLRITLTQPTQITVAAVDAEALLDREPQTIALAGHLLGGLLPSLVTGLYRGMADGQDPSDAGWLDRIALGLSAEVDKLPSGSLGTGGVYASADAFMRAHVAEPNLRVIDIANGLGVQVQTIERAFRQRRTSALQHLMSLRISAAREATATTTDLDLENLAAETGFYDAAHLKRCWRKIEGRPLVGV